MQRELDAEGTPLPVQILGVNGIGLESGNALACDGRDLPWLQDTADVNVWASWGVTYRDVVILDRLNRVFAVYNLTDHNLAIGSNRDQLKELLRAAGER